ncbi:hypothetical protein FQZ97_739260 [compost metagenome]
MRPTRSQATQHNRAEWVCTRWRPRYSQMPASGSKAKQAAREASDSSRRSMASSPGFGRRSSTKLCATASTTEPKTSCWICSAAWLPTRTGP